MTLVVGDRIQETTTTTGTGTITLLGAVTQFQSFAAGVGNGNSTYYTIADQSGVNWEEGIGTYTTSGSTLTRTVLASSNAGALVNFPAGTKNVFCSYPAEAAVLAAPYAYPTVSPTLNLDFANSATVDPRITFVRNSTATYYDGKTFAMAEQNLVTYSQAVGGTNWLLNTATPTLNNAVAPDATTTASLITLTASSNFQTYQNTTTLTGQLTMSCYIKTGSITWMQFFYGGTNGEYANFNVSTGALGNYTGTATITSVGSGWYRCTHTFTPSTNINNIVINTVDSGTAARAAVTVLTSGTWYLWGAQLEQRSSATAYTPTTTAAITNYIPQLMTAPAGVPRLDYDPITGKPLGLLIEESRTNLLTNSQAIGGTNWVMGGNVGGACNQNVAIAPDGTLTATKFVTPSGAAVSTYVYQTITTAAGTFVGSIYLKYAGYQYVQVFCRTILDYVNIDLLNGIITASSIGIPAITSVGNGWYRVALTSTLSATLNNNSITPIQTGTSGRATTFISDGYSGIYIWGAQLEAGSFATSYIPTTSAAVTRAADQASMTGTNFSSWYNQAQGTIYGEFDLLSVSINAMVPYAIDNGSSNGYSFYKSLSSSNLYAYAGSNSALLLNGTTVANTTYKTIIAYGASIYATVNGASPSSITTGGLSGGNPNKLSLGYSLASSNPMSGHIRKINYYATALPSAVLQSLTS